MRSNRGVLAFGLLLAVAAVMSAEEVALERDIWGYFRPAKQPPPAFANIAELHLAGRGEYGWKASPPHYGMTKLKGSKGATYRIQPPEIDGLKIRFATEALRGISYDFNGTLARSDFSRGGIAPDEVMLRGRMRKLHNGRPEAAAELEFFFTEGG